MSKLLDPKDELDRSTRARIDVVASPDLADKLRRALWNLVWWGLFRPSPIPMFGWRCFLLRLFGARIARGARPYPSTQIWAPWNLTMEEGSCLGLGSEVFNVATVTLGVDSIVSQRAYLCTASHSIREPGFALMAAPITIGPKAWVAASAFIGPGVTLEQGAVAAAASVVMKNVERNVVVAGNPAVPKGRGKLADLT